MKKILLLRGVNVGGVKLPMAGLCDLLARLGLENVRSYIQSGNAVFDDPGITSLTERIAAELKFSFGLSPALFVFTPAEFDDVLAQSPFRAEGEADGAKVHVHFLAEPAVISPAALQDLATTERFLLTDRALHLHAPDGVGRSVLAEKLPRLLKVASTARNWNTVSALSAMAKTD